MLSETFCEQAERTFRESLPSFGKRGETLLCGTESLGREERALVRFAYATLPSQDACDVPVSVMKSYADHALKLREESPYSREISEEMFLHFVFYPRVNSEDIVDCRPFFYEQLAPRIRGLDAEEAALSVNVFCAEHVTYEASDPRTENPLTAFKSGYGRCGEESTFVVSACRSVGIPARQIYVPYWAHCDDNHAWVEVYVSGRWQYLGACEPEPVLNRGWFTDAATRAPLAVFRTFSPYEDEEQGSEPVNPLAPAWEPCLYSVTGRYADTVPLTVCVKDESGGPVPGAWVELSVVNAARLCPVALGYADGSGRYRLSVGRGTIHAAAGRRDEKEEGAGKALAGERAEADLLLAGEAEAHLTLTLAPFWEKTWETDFIPPAATEKNRTVLTQEEQAESEAGLAGWERRREENRRSFEREEYEEAPAAWQELFQKAGGNAPEIYRFYASRTGKERDRALSFLLSLRGKDIKDGTYPVLEAHFAASEDPAVQNPRILNEVLGDWRSAVRQCFAGEEERIRNDPAGLLREIEARFPDGAGRYYKTLSIRPEATLAMGQSDETGRRILWAAVLRTFGVPARLNPADGACEFRADGAWHRVRSGEEGTAPGEALEEDRVPVRFLSADSSAFFYGGNWTLAKRKADGSFRVLDREALPGESAPREECTLFLAAASYRLITANRLPNGTSLCRFTDFSVTGEEERDPEKAREIPLILREGTPEEMLGNAHLAPFALKREDGSLWRSEALAGDTLFCFLEPGREPTEHLLREFLEAVNRIRPLMAERVLDVIFVLRAPGEEKGLCQEVHKSLPGLSVLYDDFGPAAGALARKLFLEPGIRPLVFLTDPDLRGVYGSCGYRVGIVDLILKLAACKREEDRRRTSPCGKEEESVENRPAG